MKPLNFFKLHEKSVEINPEFDISSLYGFQRF